jgi:hypothetical protein
MFGTEALRRVAAAVFIVALFAMSIYADTVRLKDGSIIKGKITNFDGGKFTIEIGEGTRKRQLNFDAAEVESIEFESVARPAVSSSRQTPDSTRYEPVVTRNAETAAPTRTETPKTESVQEPRVSAPISIPGATGTAAAKPIELTVKVLADNTANGWTNSGWVLKKGQRVRITGTGEVSLGKGKTSDPGGLWDLEDPNKLLSAVPTGALIAVVGDDNNEFLYIGNDREFTASRDGALFLGVNEGNLNDNSGSYSVKIEIFPGS